MTYIEFFDTNAAENICGCLVNPPERVVLVGKENSILEKHAERYEELFLKRGHSVDFVCRKIRFDGLDSVVAELERIIGEYGECAFDLTGGDETYLVAVGMLYERHRDKGVKMHRFNVRNGRIFDCDRDGVTIMENEELEMSVRENIRIYGGDVVFDDVNPLGTHAWDMNEKFKKDIKAMWEVCKVNPTAWNIQMDIFDAALKLAADSDAPLKATVNATRLLNRYNRDKKKPISHDDLINEAILKALNEKHFVTEYSLDEKSFSVTFLNDQIKRCLTKAGQALEMLVYSTALELTDHRGQPVYNDAMNGVYIDWDGIVSEAPGKYDTANEIDVMMMHGVVPVFVSCKNGSVALEELYKLNSVAERFGGDYSKKVLIATSLDAPSSTYDEFFRQRAKDMKIKLIEGLQDMTDDEIDELFKGLWR